MLPRHNHQSTFVRWQCTWPYLSDSVQRFGAKIILNFQITALGPCTAMAARVSDNKHGVGESVQKATFLSAFYNLCNLCNLWSAFFSCAFSKKPLVLCQTQQRRFISYTNRMIKQFIGPQVLKVITKGYGSAKWA